MTAASGVLPPVVQTNLEELLGTRVTGTMMLSGGMVNQAARVETSDGLVFVKWNYDPLPGLFTAEVKGLRALQATQTLRVPHVLAVSDTASPAFLMLEYIEENPSPDPSAFTNRFAEGLAALHQHTASPFGFGLEEHNYLGALPQTNTPSYSWPDFYRECRLLPQIEIARQRKLLPAPRERLLMQVVEKLEILLADLESRPALIHGDLWSGNFLTAGEEPIIIDPAISYSEREMEIAFIELFGGFPPGFVAAYHNIYPLDAGYQQRRPLHQLYPLLVHLNHFGETYGPRVERVCQFYV